ncbi:hypothetical protein ACH5RR_017717 [Cinchona calisaya]|uniref:F-box domain-containing protein n=1 Tax=Cinchona calisaya TaxID=153742 RepID=A0ABD2ZJQ8_9GENT
MRKDRVSSGNIYEQKLFSNNKSEIFLPREIIFDILIRLPLKSLGRCTCVCKLWHAIVEDHKFVLEYSDRSNFVYEYKDDTNAAGEEQQASWLSTVNGLVLQKSKLTKKYRIMNVATKEILDLPNPHDTVYYMSIFYLPTTDIYKLICIFGNGGGARRGKKGTTKGGCEIMTLGTDRTWRTLDIPSLYDLGSKWAWLRLVVTDDLFFLAKFCDPGFGVSEIVRIDVGTEHFEKIRIPHDFFSSWENVRPFLWDTKLCLANKVEQELHVYTLEDHKKEQWAQRKIVIHLSFLNEYPEFQHVFPYEFENGWLWFFPRNAHHIAYDIDSKSVHIANRLPLGKRHLACVKYTPVSLARIQRKEEVNSEVIRPKENPNMQGPEFSPKCKCVCKLWCAIIEEGNFVIDYSSRSEIVYYEYRDETNAAGDVEEVLWLSVINGLVLEKTALTKKYRLRNPATKEILDLPNPRDTVYYIKMFYLPKTNNYKLVYVCGKEGTRRGKKGTRKGGCEVMTLGTDCTRRRLDIPSLYNLGSKRAWLNLVVTDDLFFITKFYDPGFGVFKVVCIDMGSEQFVNFRIPQILFSSWKNVQPFL